MTKPIKIPDRWLQGAMATGRRSLHDAIALWLEQERLDASFVQLIEKAQRER